MQEDEDERKAEGALAGLAWRGMFPRRAQVQPARLSPAFERDAKRRDVPFLGVHLAHMPD